MQAEELRKVAQDLIEGLTADEIREFAIVALRRWRASRPDLPFFNMRDHFGVALIELLAPRKGITIAEPLAVSTAMVSEKHFPPVIEFTSWLVRAGLAIPLYHHGPNTYGNGYPTAYHLTVTGTRFLDTVGDHPLLPGFVERVAARCPDLPNEVAVHLVDAQACLDHGLGRPAIVLAGLAYEAAIDDAIEHLESEGKLVVKKGNKAAQRIGAVKDIIPQLLADAEQRGRAMAAWDFADRLRERRNDASHPGAVPDFSDLSEVHEWLLSAGRNLPGLWSVAV